MALTRSGTSDDEGGEHGHPDFSRMEVSLRTLLEAQNQCLIAACTNNVVNIEQNVKSISELNDLILGLSAQVAKLVYPDSFDSDSKDNSHEMVRDNHSNDIHNRFSSYAAKKTKVDFSKFDRTEMQPFFSS